LLLGAPGKRFILKPGNCGSLPPYYEMLLVQKNPACITASSLGLA